MTIFFVSVVTWFVMITLKQKCCCFTTDAKGKRLPNTLNCDTEGFMKQFELVVIYLVL